MGLILSAGGLKGAAAEGLDTVGRWEGMAKAGAGGAVSRNSLGFFAGR